MPLVQGPTTTAVLPMSKFDRVKSGVLGALILSLGLGICLAYGLNTESFLFPKWLFFLFGALLAVPFFVNHLVIERRLDLDRVDRSGLLLLLYGVTSLSWSPDPRAGAIEALYGCIAIVCYLALRRLSGRQLERLAAAICCLGLIAVLSRIAAKIEIYGGFGNENVVTEFVVLASPLAATWWRTGDKITKWIVPILLPAGIAYVLAVTASKMAFIAIPCQLAVGAAIAYRKQLRSSYGTILAVAGSVVAASVAIASALSPSVRISLSQRLELSLNTLQMWLQSPIIGNGWGSFDYEYPRHLGAFALINPGADNPTLTQMLHFAGAAHNEPLQFLATFGLVGLALAINVSITMYRAFRNRAIDPDAKLAALCTLTATAVIACGDFVLQNPALIFLNVLALAILTNTASADIVSVSPQRILPVWLVRTAAGAALFVATAASFAMLRSYICYWYYGAAVRLLQVSPERAYDYNWQAYLAFPANVEPRRQLFVSLVQWLEWDGSIPYTLARQDAVYEISATTGPDWPGLQISRIYHYVLTGRAETHRSEIENMLQGLKARIPTLSEIYFVEAFYELDIRDFGRAALSLEAARHRIANLEPSLKGPQLEKLSALERLINERDGEQPGPSR